MDVFLIYSARRILSNKIINSNQSSVLFVVNTPCFLFVIVVQGIFCSISSFFPTNNLENDRIVQLFITRFLCPKTQYCNLDFSEECKNEPLNLQVWKNIRNVFFVASFIHDLLCFFRREKLGLKTTTCHFIAIFFDWWLFLPTRKKRSKDDTIFELNTDEHGIFFVMLIDSLLDLFSVTHV